MIFVCKYTFTINTKTIHQYCVMEHYYRGNIYSICSNNFAVKTLADHLSDHDLDQIRQLPSFRPYVEQITDCEQIIALLKDTAYLRERLPDMIRSVRRYFAFFHCSLRIVVELLHDVPTTDNITFKQLRSLYADCAEQPISTLPEFTKCWHMLGLMSKTELIPKLWSVTNVITAFIYQFSEFFTETDVDIVLLKVMCCILYYRHFVLLHAKNTLVIRSW